MSRKLPGRVWALGACALAMGLGACASGDDDECNSIDATLVERIEVSPGSSTVTPGGTVSLTATPFSCAGPLAAVPVVWESQNTAIATVSAAGVVSAVAVGGPVAITARAQGKAGTSSVTVSDVQVDSVAVSPSSVDVGVGLTAQLTARTFDADGEEILGRPVTWSSTNDGLATVSGSGLVTGVQVGGPVQVTATVEGKSGSAEVTVVVGSATRLGFVVQPSTVAAGAAITPAIQVEVLDAAGNRVTSPDVAVTLALVNNPGGAVLAGTLTRTSNNGIARFDNITLNRPGTGYTLIAASSGLTSVTSNAFEVRPGTLDRLAFVTQPGNTAAGEVIAPPVQVELLDASGNRLTGSTAPVTMALVANPGGGILGGTLTVNAVQGLAEFRDLAVNRPGEGYTLGATAGSLAPEVSVPFTVVAGRATRLRFVTDPPVTLTAGTAFTVAVEVLDQAGNRVTDATGPVSLALANGSGDAVLLGNTVASPDAGVATFTNLSVVRAGTGYTLLATSDGLTEAGSTPFSVLAGPASALSFFVQPSNIEEGDAFPGPLQVQIVDALGNRVLTATNLVTITVRSASGGGAPAGVTLGGDGTQNAVAGLAQFPGLTVNLSGVIQLPVTIRLRAAAGGFSNLNSDQFVVTPD